MLRVDLPELQAEGIVLCSFRADTVDYQPVPRRFLCFRWEKLVPREAEEAYFCVFIPLVIADSFGGPSQGAFSAISASENLDLAPLNLRLSSLN